MTEEQLLYYLLIICDFALQYVILSLVMGLVITIEFSLNCPEEIKEYKFKDYVGIWLAFSSMWIDYILILFFRI